MGNTNTLPVISQTKSLVQLATGDREGARATQEKFLHECPIVAQATSAVEYAIDRDKDKMVETNKRSARVISNFADGIPVVGHVKGGIHALAGDADGARAAVKSANRSVGVVGGGAVGFLAGGFPGAIAGGIAGGAAMDGIQTGISSAYHKEFRPSGSIAAVKQAIDNPTGATVFDAVAVPVFDGVAGYGAGQLTSQIQAGMTSAQLASDGVLQSEAAAIAAEAAEASAADAAAAASQQQQPAAAPAAGGAAGAAGVDPAASGPQHNLQQLGEAIVTKKTDIVKAAVDPRGGTVELPARIGLDALKSLPKSAGKWSTVPSVSPAQIQQLLDGLKTVDKILATTKDLTAIATGRGQVDLLVPGLSLPLKTILNEILRFAAANMPRREEIASRTAELAQRLRDLATRSTPERTAADAAAAAAAAAEPERRKELRCVHWNMAGVSAELVEHLGLVWSIVLDCPDVLLLNHVIASEHLMNALTSVLGYRFLKFPAASVIEDEEDGGAPGGAASGSALLFRPRAGIACVGAGSEGGGEEGYELVWLDVQQQEPVDEDQVTLGPICRLLNVQCEGGREQLERVTEAVKRLTADCPTVVCTTVPRATRAALMDAVGLVKCSSDADNYDAVLTTEAAMRHVLCHRSPQSSAADESTTGASEGAAGDEISMPVASSSCVSLARAQPFTVGEGINVGGAIGSCGKEACYYGCGLQPE